MHCKLCGFASGCEAPAKRASTEAPQDTVTHGIVSKHQVSLCDGVERCVLQRDMAERGHSEESIKASIEARKPDFDAYIDPQKKNADVIIQARA
jgi:Phosphoribulokinase / Uridine kinase family